MKNLGDQFTPSTHKIIMYGTPTCPMVPPVRGVLKRAGAEFDYVNIAEDAAGALRVKAINDGYASVPTLVFPDGSTLTEPSTAVLSQKLKSLGYAIPAPTPWQSLQENPFWTLLGTFALLFGVYDSNLVFTILGLLILGYVLLAGRLGQP